jgi:hypothetical protein
MHRALSVLLVAGLWVLTSVWTSAARLAAEREGADECCTETTDCLDAACSCCVGRELDSAELATRSHHALAGASPAFAPLSVTEVDAPATRGSIVPRRHDTPRSARGPPARG